jgi:hypothetical protein
MHVHRPIQILQLQAVSLLNSRLHGKQASLFHFDPSLQRFGSLIFEFLFGEGYDLLIRAYL